MDTTKQPGGEALGDLVVASGLCDQAVVERALAAQREDARRGVFRRLGEILVEQGSLDHAQVQALLSRQGRTILSCTACGTQFTVDGWSAGREASCTRCGGRLEVPAALARVSVEDDIGAHRPARDAAPAAPPAAPTASAPAPASVYHRSGLSPGRFGPYDILGEISRGGMGIVYKARQIAAGRIVALKILTDSHLDPEGIERFGREARALSSLRHPNIVAVHDVGEVEGVSYFSMDFVEGLTLDRAIPVDGILERDVAGIFEKICDAIAYAHAQGVVHRDLKPNNIMLDKRREPIIIDFGIARVERVEKAEGALTNPAFLLGTPPYLAPEYLSGEVAAYDELCDVYSLGACLYTALAGKPPYGDLDTVRRLMSAQKSAAPLAPLRPRVDKSLATIALVALEHSRPHRYRSAREMALDLRRWLEGETILARSSQTVRWWRRVRVRVAVALGLLVSFGLVGMSGYYASRIRSLELSQGAPGDERALVAEIVGLHLELGEERLRGGHAREAERDATEAVSKAQGPRLAEALRLRARVRRALGQDAGAVEDERRAADARPMDR